MKYSLLLFYSLLLIGSYSCTKEQEPSPALDIPAGATVFTDTDIQFVPYTSQSVIYKDQDDNSLTLNFVERKRTEAYYAWDQTYFTFSTNAELKVEMRLRYLQSDVSKKTLAIYMPYYDNSNVLRNNLFELPIDNSSIETSFFEYIIDFHDTLVINSIERYDVYEVRELVSTDANKDGSKNFSKLFYNRHNGLIEFHQKDGVIWTMQ